MNHIRRTSRLAVCLLLAILSSSCTGGQVETQTPGPLPPEAETQLPEPLPTSPVPENGDSDQDGLGDDQELTETLTDPNNLDTDGDGLKDGQEVVQYRTSPLLSDTDGDGMTDFQEARSGGTSPLLADMPQLSIELFGNPSIVVNNYTVSEGSRKEALELVENKELKEKTESEKTNLSVENNIKLHTEAEVGTSQWPPSASAKLTTDSTFSQGYFHNTSANWEKSSLENLQEKYATWEEKNATYSDGELSVALKINNLSAMSVRLKNLVVNVYQPDKTLIGNIRPNADTWPEGGALLEPGGNITITLKNDKIPAQKIKTILENPTALVFQVGSYEMYKVDDAGSSTVNFGILSQSVIRQSGMISINYGNGTLERYLLATNVVRNADGSAKGVTLSRALSEIIGLKYETCPQVDEKGNKTGITVLCRVENQATFDDRNDGDDNNSYGFWRVAGTGTQFGAGDIKNFEKIVLKPKESVYLVYFKDSDGDKIFDSDEYLLGTDKDRADTDGDGLTDYDEAIKGWKVGLIDRGKKPYQKTSDPLLPNRDGDGWNDKEEYEHETDPEMADTDGDEIADEQDEVPLGTCLAVKPALGLAAWWQPEYDPSSKIYFAKDIGIAGDASQNGVLVGEYDPTKMAFYRGGVPYFSMNRGPNTDNQYISVKSNKLLNLSGKKDFTLAVDLVWDGEMASGQEIATVISKGSEGPQVPTFALYIQKNGAITFTVYRHVNEKCWWLGDDGGCKDEHHDINDKLTTQSGLISKGQKYHIIATFTDDLMRIYVNGILKREYWTPNKHDWRIYEVRDDFLNLITNDDPFVIGNTLTGQSSKWPFKGMITNIQFFNAKMIPDNVTKLDKFDLCLPPP